MSIKNSAELAERNARRKRLKDFEKVIDKAAAAFREMGEALGRIRKEGLYTELGYETFDGYVSDRFDISPRHADRLIGAARVALMLRPMGLEINNERTARELVVFGSDARKMAAVCTAVESR